MEQSCRETRVAFADGPMDIREGRVRAFELADCIEEPTVCSRCRQSFVAVAFQLGIAQTTQRFRHSEPPALASGSSGLAASGFISSGWHEYTDSWSPHAYQMASDAGPVAQSVPSIPTITTGGSTQPAGGRGDLGCHPFGCGQPGSFNRQAFLHPGRCLRRGGEAFTSRGGIPQVETSHPIFCRLSTSTTAENPAPSAPKRSLHHNPCS